MSCASHPPNATRRSRATSLSWCCGLCGNGGDHDNGPGQPMRARAGRGHGRRPSRWGLPSGRCPSRSERSERSDGGKPQEAVSPGPRRRSAPHRLGTARCARSPRHPLRPLSHGCAVRWPSHGRRGMSGLWGLSAGFGPCQRSGEREAPGWAPTADAARRPHGRTPGTAYAAGGPADFGRRTRTPHIGRRTAPPAEARTSPHSGTGECGEGPTTRSNL